MRWGNAAPWIVALAMALTACVAVVMHLNNGSVTPPATAVVAPPTPVPSLFAATEPPSTVRAATVTIHGVADPGAQVRAFGRETVTTTTRSSGHWSIKVPLDLGENEILVAADDPGSDGSTFYVTRKRTAEQVAAARARAELRRQLAAEERASKCSADPASCMSDKEIVQACAESRINDYDTCFKASYRHTQKLLEDADRGR